MMRNICKVNKRSYVRNFKTTCLVKFTNLYSQLPATSEKCPKMSSISKEFKNEALVCKNDLDMRIAGELNYLAGGSQVT